jgi:hypothetical protein
MFYTENSEKKLSIKRMENFNVQYSYFGKLSRKSALGIQDLYGH